MAQKKVMNVWLAFSDKIALVVALGVLGYVIYAQFLNKQGVENRGEVVSPSQLIEKGIEESQLNVNAMKMNSKKIPPQPTLHLKEFLSIKQLDTIAVDTDRLYPAISVIDDIVLGPFKLPRILALTETELELSREVGYADNSAQEVADIDFVTIYSKLHIAKIRENYISSFAAHDIETPLKDPDPVVAMVEVSRQQLDDNGLWGSWETIDRIVVDPYYGKRPAASMSKMSLAQLKVLIIEGADPVVQQSMLQPAPYEFTDVEWLPLFERRELVKEREAADRQARISAAKTGKGRGPGGDDLGMDMSGGGGRTRRPAGGAGGADRGGGDFGSDDFGGGMGMGMGVGVGGGGGRTRNRSGNSAIDIDTEAFLTEQMFPIWAHDGTVHPGEIYQYRIRVGFYNPVAGHPKWLVDTDKKYADNAILWTAWDNIEQIVEVPIDVAIFPKRDGKKEDREMRVEVYKWFKGKWYKDEFEVRPGGQIGEVVKSVNNSHDGLDIDFTTGATVIDIVYGNHYSSKIGSTIKSVECNDLIYQDKNGTIIRMPLSKQMWPQTLNKMKNGLDKKLRGYRRAL